MSGPENIWLVENNFKEIKAKGSCEQFKWDLRNENEMIFESLIWIKEISLIVLANL